MTYTRDMAIRIALFTIPFVAVAALVLLLNEVKAGPGIAAASFGLFAVATGTALGYFADRLPEFRARPYCRGRTASEQP